MTSIDTSIIKRLDAIFSSADTHEEGARKMNAEFVVIPRSELPEVVEIGRNFRVGHVYYVSARSSDERRSEALDLLALAEHIEARAATEAKRNARRDELAGIYFPEVCYGEPKVTGYVILKPGIKAAIDRIIELEEAAA